MNGICLALYEAALAYDIKNGRKKLTKRFPEINIITPPANNNTDFAIAHTVDYITLNINVMGTHGENTCEKFDAWVRNFDMEPQEDGLPRGFKMSARWLVNYFGTYINYEKFDYIHLKGHSAGSSIIFAMATILSNEVTHPKFLTTCFAGPPDGNYKAKKYYNRMHLAGRWNQVKVVNPRDIVTQLWRTEIDKEKNGIDCGRIITLPCDTRFQRFLYKYFRNFHSIHEHSPKEHCDGMIEYVKCNSDNWKEEIRFLKSIRKEMVN